MVESGRREPKPRKSTEETSKSSVESVKNKNTTAGRPEDEVKERHTHPADQGGLLDGNEQGDRHIKWRFEVNWTGPQQLRQRWREGRSQLVERTVEFAKHPQGIQQDGGQVGQPQVGRDGKLGDCEKVGVKVLVRVC